MLTLLIDADAFAWKAATLSGTVAEAHRKALNRVHRMVDELKADRAVVCLSDPSRVYWRHELFADYKANSSERPPLFEDAIAGLKAAAPHRVWPKMEADDVVGVLATHPSVQGDKIIVSEDSDLKSIPGRHYHPKTKETIDVTPAEADYWHLYRTIVGKGFPGCKGLGKGKVGNFLPLDMARRPPAEAWAAVVRAFASKKQAADDALLQARIARICRATDYDIESHQVRPWKPPVLLEEAVAA